MKGPMNFGSRPRSGAAAGASTATVKTDMLAAVRTASMAKVTKTMEGFIEFYGPRL
jgi:hypothetical protein